MKPQYTPIDDERALKAHPNPSHAKKWQAAIENVLRKGKKPLWIMDKPIVRQQ